MEENKIINDNEEREENLSVDGVDVNVFDKSNIEKEQISSDAISEAHQGAEEELPVCIEPQEHEMIDRGDIPASPVYHWNYEAQKTYDSNKNKEKRSKAAIIYASIMTGAFLLAFTILVGLLLYNWIGTITKGESNQGGNQVASSSDRVVYVREYNSESGVLTTQELYNKCLPSIVSVSVSSESASGIGSGFIISEDGYIVTANHVIDGMTRVRVILSNDEAYDAQVINGNEFTDIALLKINKTGLPAIKIGSSDDLLVGDNVIAIGTPAAIDFAGSLAEGVVSYNNRSFKIYNEDGSVQKKMTLIQTNALVNPGNSGCPLINEYGEVVGIVTMKLNSTYYEGMCFAIPMDSAMPIIDAMRKGENYDALLSAVSQYPAKLGITVESASSKVDGKDIYGVKVASVQAGYDSYRKLNVGDVITRIDSVPTPSIDDISRMLNKYDPEDTVKVTLYRNGQEIEVDLVLGK